MTHDHNAIVDLVELLLRVAKAENDAAETEVRVDLRLAAADLDGDNGLSFNVAVQKMWISLDLSGLTISPGARHGEPTKPNQVDVERTTKTENVVEKQAHAGLNLRLDPKAFVGDGSIEGGAKHNSAGKRTVSETASEKSPHIRVKARGGNRWEIAEADGELLDGTYLSNDLLCRVVATAGANSQIVELCAYAKQKDIVLKATRNGTRIPFLTNNHEKMLKILIAKAISASGSSYAGTIAFSKSEGEIEK